MNELKKAAPWLVVLVVIVGAAYFWFEQKKQAMHSELQAAVLAKQLEAARLPEVEVDVTVRKALVATGLVAQFKNLSGSVLPVNVRFERTGAKSKYLALTLDPKKVQEFGGMEGWSFAPGDKITVEQTGHKTKTWVVP